MHKAITNKVVLAIASVIVLSAIAGDSIADQVQMPTYTLFMQSGTNDNNPCHYFCGPTVQSGFASFEAANSLGSSIQTAICGTLGGTAYPIVIVGGNLAENVANQGGIRCLDQNGYNIIGVPSVTIASQCPPLWNNLAVSPPSGTESICRTGDNVPNVFKQQGVPKQCGLVGNPCNVGTGNKTQTERDYRGGGSSPLLIERTYNSQTGLIGSYGRNWWGNYDRRLTLPASFSANPHIGVFSEDGKIITYTLANGVWSSTGDIDDRLEQLSVGWRVTRSNDDIELYNAAGKLTSITTRQGISTTFQHSDGTTSGPNGAVIYDTSSGVPVATTKPLPQGFLIQVTDFSGRAITLKYDAVYRVVQMVDPAGGTYNYSYDGNNMLVAVKGPDDFTKHYLYEVAAKPYLLNGVTDENGDRYATYLYDSNGLVTSSEHAGGAEKVTLVYPTIPNGGTGETQVTTFVDTALTAVRSYSLTVKNGVTLTASIAGSACPSCGPKTLAYDANGYPESIKDWNDKLTTYVRADAQGRRDLETSRTEGLAADGSNTAVTRTIQTTWHPIFRLPTSKSEPLRITTYVYNGDGVFNCGYKADGTTPVPGVLCSMTVNATTDATGALGLSATLTGNPLTWAYTYNPDGQVLTVNGPRADVSDVTTYAYWDKAATCDTSVSGASATGCRGQIHTIASNTGTQQLTTTFAAYNAHGQPLVIIDPNGLTTNLTYDPRMRLATRNVGGENTTYHYDNAGQLIRVTMPDSSELKYTYDSAHRLTRVTDSLGNKIVYTLDAMGNRILEQVFDAATLPEILPPANVLVLTRSRDYNSQNRLQKNIGANVQAEITTYGYDDQGNLTSINGPLPDAPGPPDITTMTYDALNRLTNVTYPKIHATDASGPSIKYDYNGRDQTILIKDPRNATDPNHFITSYAYDGLNNLKQVMSPESGTTQYSYDEAGNLKTQIDAKNQTTNYTYDALNRVASIKYDGETTPSVTFTYDQGTNGLGHLSGISDSTGTISYGYNSHGRLEAETRVIAGITYTTGYGYDTSGRLATITYPGGRQIQYTRDGVGRIYSISTTKNNVSQSLINGVIYSPFGSEVEFTYGNSRIYRRDFDLNGRVAQYQMPSNTLKVCYDDASRITSFSDSNLLCGNVANPAYGYDLLDRLTSFISPTSSQNFDYDLSGNRILNVIGSNAYTLTYEDTGNRIVRVASASGSVLKNYGLDNNGSIFTEGTGSGARQFTYDARGRLIRATTSTNVNHQYLVNTLGQRVKKNSNNTDATVFHYDVSGKLISETDLNGIVRVEYVYLNDIPVAVLK